MNLYALHDYDKDLKAQGAFPVTKERAQALNKQGYAIHFTPNEINGKRVAANVTAIKYWFAEFDTLTKQEQMRKINKILLRPTAIIESKRGYHVYWKALDASIENFKIICKGISIKLGTDEAIITANRIMRAPGFYHMKDKDNPFLVKLVFKSNETYSEKEMFYAFPYKEKKSMRRGTYEKTDNKSEMLNPENWRKIFFLDRFVQGCRNNEFARITLWLRDEGFSSHEITASVHEMNRMIAEPLPESEINSILRGKV